MEGGLVMTEIRLAHLYALAVLEYADVKGLNDVYRQVSVLVRSGKIRAENAEPEDLRELLRKVPPNELEDTLMRFLDIARSKMNSIFVEVISAVPLTEKQLYEVQYNLIRKLRRQLDFTATVDPSIIGGIRIIIEDRVIDHSVRHFLLDMKEALYKGVYQTHA